MNSNIEQIQKALRKHFDYVVFSFNTEKGLVLFDFGALPSYHKRVAVEERDIMFLYPYDIVNMIWENHIYEDLSRRS